MTKARCWSASSAAGLRSVRTIWSTLIWPQPPVALSTASIRAVLPANSPTSHDWISSASLPPGRVFGPVAVRTTLPSTRRFRQVFPAQPPPPIRKVRNFRSIGNSGDVSVPVGRSPPVKELTQPLPWKPVTVI